MSTALEPDPAPEHGSAGGLGALLRPRSVAVIGISRPAPGKSRIGGHAVLTALAEGGFPGPVFPIHPEVREFGGIRAHRSIADLPATPDVLVVARPAATVPGILREAGAAGIRAAVVMSSGFAEAGTEEGADLEAEIRAVCAEQGIALCGPNTLGLMNVATRTYLCNFAPLEYRFPEAGGLAIVSQSGAVAGSLISLATQHGIGLSAVVAGGNDTVLGTADYVRELAASDDVTSVALYLEGVANGRALTAAVGACTAAGKPVSVLKAGTSASGARAALSHTAKVAGSAEVYREALRQAGATVVTTLDELVLNGSYRQAGFTGDAAPRRVAVVTLSGGLGAILADEFSRHGIAVPELSGATRDALAALDLPLGGSSNPVDTAGATQRQESPLADIVLTTAADDGIDAVVVALPARYAAGTRQTPDDLLAVRRSTTKPVLAVWVAGAESDDAVSRLRSGGVPTFRNPRDCARALAAAVDFAERPGRSGFAPSSEPGGPAAWLSEPETKRLLGEYGMRCPDETVTRTPAEAAAAADRIGHPVVVKVVSADVVHKNAVGGVRLGVADGDVERAFTDVVANVTDRAPGSTVDGVLVGESVPPGAEFLVGAFRDEAFGPMLVFGRGGSRVEQDARVTMRMLPLSEHDDADLVREGLHLAAPGGPETLPDGAEQGLRDAVRAVADFAWDHRDRLHEIDVNPVVVAGDGRVLALDAIARMTTPDPATAPEVAQQ